MPANRSAGLKVYTKIEISIPNIEAVIIPNPTRPVSRFCVCTARSQQAWSQIDRPSNEHPGRVAALQAEAHRGAAEYPPVKAC